MTIEEVKTAVEEHLSKFIHNPEMEVDVLAYNSKVIYIVADGGGSGESVVRVPFTGNETVLDAMASVDGLSEVAAKNNMWVARPGPHGTHVTQKMSAHCPPTTHTSLTPPHFHCL